MAREYERSVMRRDAALVGFFTLSALGGVYFEDRITATAAALLAGERAASFLRSVVQYHR